MIEERNGNSSLCYQAYPFKDGFLYLIGDDDMLKYSCFSWSFDESKYLKSVSRRVTKPIKEAIKFLDSYFKGNPMGLPPLDLSQFTKKELSVYKALMKVPFGRTISYGELSKKAGITNGGRFVGNSMAKNAFPIFIPCHRVIRGNGDLGNYGGGTDIKRFLLEHENGHITKK